MSGKEVFISDNSRKIANNNNDLLERWLIRSGGELAPVVDICPSKTVHKDESTEKISTITQARIIKKSLSLEINKYESLLGGVDKKGNVDLRSFLHTHKGELVKAIILVNKFISEWSNLDSDINLRLLIQNNDSDLKETAESILQFRNLKKDKPDYWLSDEDYNNICDKQCKIRDELMRRKLSEPK